MQPQRWSYEMKMISTLIIDDEWLIRLELKNMLRPYPEIQIIGEANSISNALKLIHTSPRDLIFLDIQLPDGSGFDFLNQVPRDFLLVFITAFDQYRIPAQKYQPLDYLMKPISKNKLHQVIQKVRTRVLEPTSPANAAAQT